MIFVTKLNQVIDSFKVKITKISKDLNGNDVEIIDREYQISPEVQKNIIAIKQIDLDKEKEILDKMNAALK